MKNFLIQIQQKIEENHLLYPLDVALVGATGVGKSSTINLLFGNERAKVGTGVDPETKENSFYELNKYFRIHDTAGLGDGILDTKYRENLDNLLRTTVNEGQYYYIDMVLIVLDAGSRDLGTALDLIDNVILTNIAPDRVVIVLNQADMAMKGHHWNKIENKPNEKLKQFLDEKSLSIQHRIKESTGLTIPKPIYYSAYHQYNLNALMQQIINTMPLARRMNNY